MLLLVVVFAMTWFLLNRTSIGRQIYAIGGNRGRRAAARLQRASACTSSSTAIWASIAGIASLVQAQLAQSVAPTVLVGKELDVLAAVVLGGASLIGGVGTVLGTILGLTLLAVMQNGLVLLGVSSYWSQFFVGLVILVSVSSTALGLRRRARSVVAERRDAALSGEAPAHRAARQRRKLPVGDGTNARPERAPRRAARRLFGLDHRRAPLLRVGAAARWPSSCRSSASCRSP